MIFRIGIDIGGVISKYPAEFKALIRALSQSTEFEVFIITDMPKSDARIVLKDNHIDICDSKLLCSDWIKDGDLCKTVLMKEHKIDIMIDDRLDYIMQGVHLGLFVIPRPESGYFAKEWNYPDLRTQRLEQLAEELGYDLIKKI